jgi:hypothetical protein
MTTAELAEATKEFDGPVDKSKWRPLTGKERATFERERRRPAISIYTERGKTKQVKILLDKSIVDRCEKFAAKHNMTLSQVINLGLRSALVFAP